MNLDEAEVAFQAWVDPYAKANVFLSVTKQGIDVEEGYAQFVTLPYDLTAKVGKFKALFGKANTWHTHVRPWVDQPLVIHNFFGDEQLADNGISVSHDIANPYNLFIEATGEVFSGYANGVFQRVADNDLFYNGHLKVFRELNENMNLEVGTSYARGTVGGAGSGSFGGVDVTYRRNRRSSRVRPAMPRSGSKAASPSRGCRSSASHSASTNCSRRSRRSARGGSAARLRSWRASSRPERQTSRACLRLR